MVANISVCPLSNSYFRKHRERIVSHPKVAVSNMNAEMCIVLLIMLTRTNLQLWLCHVIWDTNSVYLRMKHTKTCHSVATAKQHDPSIIDIHESVSCPFPSASLPHSTDTIQVELFVFLLYLDWKRALPRKFVCISAVATLVTSSVTRWTRVFSGTFSATSVALSRLTYVWSKEFPAKTAVWDSSQ